MSRKRLESIVIGDNVVIMVLKLEGRQVKLGIDAPPGVPVRRQEIIGRFGKGTAGNQGKKTGGKLA
ncbi:MAG: carbon storage regulator [Bryobacteraceae bacterium]|nr:carbon storage regulator [Bryobacteraceae bacterium]